MSIRQRDDQIEFLLLQGVVDKEIQQRLKISHQTLYNAKQRIKINYALHRREQLDRINARLLAASDEAVDKVIQGMKHAKSEALQYRNAWDILDRAGVGDSKQAASAAVSINAQQNYLSVNLVRGDQKLIEAINEALNHNEANNGKRINEDKENQGD